MVTKRFVRPQRNESKRYCYQRSLSGERSLLPSQPATVNNTVCTSWRNFNCVQRHKATHYFAVGESDITVFQRKPKSYLCSSLNDFTARLDGRLSPRSRAIIDRLARRRRWCHYTRGPFVYGTYQHLHWIKLWWICCYKYRKVILAHVYVTCNLHNMQMSLSL